MEEAVGAASSVPNPNKILRFLPLRPNSSLAALRYKVWHLLDLPDFCEEKIVLKTDNDVEVSLNELRKGNTPQTAFILEVWPPEKRMQYSQIRNMLTMGQKDDVPTEDRNDRAQVIGDCNDDSPYGHNVINQSDSNFTQRTVSMTPMSVELNKHVRPVNISHDFDFKKSVAAARRSSTTLFLRLQGKKSVDNVSSVLMKIQTDLVSLTQKLSSLENRVPL